MEKKILVATDGSVYSANIIHYLSRLFTDLDDIRMHLLCIVPTTAMSAGREWMDEMDLMAAISPETKKKYTAAKRYMNEASLQLGRKGIASEQITTEVKLSRMSVSKDILHAAQKGLYDALVIGRRGISKLEELIMGSISATILESAGNVPVWIVDGHVDSRKFLVPVDGSPYSLRAVDHLSHILKGNPYAEITLFNSEAVFAKTVHANPEDFHEEWTKEWADEHINRPDSLFHAPEQVLLESGFPREKIHRLTTKKGLYPSRQIVRQALIDGFGTIVLGRRPANISKGMYKSVSSKVIGMAQDSAIWIVG